MRLIIIALVLFCCGSAMAQSEMDTLSEVADTLTNQGLMTAGPAVNFQTLWLIPGYRQCQHGDYVGGIVGAAFTGCWLGLAATLVVLDSESNDFIGPLILGVFSWTFLALDNRSGKTIIDDSSSLGFIRPAAFSVFVDPQQSRVSIGFQLAINF